MKTETKFEEWKTEVYAILREREFDFDPEEARRYWDMEGNFEAGYSAEEFATETIRQYAEGC